MLFGKDRRRVTGAVLATLSSLSMTAACGGDGGATPASSITTNGAVQTSMPTPPGSSQVREHPPTPPAQAPSAATSGPTGATATVPGSAAPRTQGGRDARGQGAGTGSGAFYPVVGIADGDTITVRVDGGKQKVRLIGLDTPETRKPGVPVQCFGKEASSHMQSLVQSKKVQLVADSSQGDRDRYGRLLRHVYVAGATNVALAQIEGGFGREYTYDGPYQHRLEYLAAQHRAKTSRRGTWGPPCNGFHEADAAAAKPPASDASRPGAPSTAPAPPPSAAPPAMPTAPAAPAAPRTGEAACAIKGNVNSKGDKIAHLPGSATYDATRITPGKGERMFCSTAEALAAGWRMARD